MTTNSSTSSVIDRPDERDPAEPAIRGEDYIGADDLSCRAWPHTLDPGAAAQIYAGLGWRVFPVHSPPHRRGRLVCSCGHDGCKRPAKHPRTCCSRCFKPGPGQPTVCTCDCLWAIHDGLNDASADPEYVARWWTRWPDANVGIRCGSCSDLFVVDLDCKPDRAALDATLGYLLSGWTPDQPAADRLWAPRRLPMTAVVSTGSGGLHLFMRHAEGLTNSHQGLQKYGSNVEVRGDGGYVVAPPSRHISGHDYQWSRTTAGFEPVLQDPPRWLVEELLAPFKVEGAAPMPAFEQTTRRGRTRRRAYLEATVAGIFRDFGGTTSRHNIALNYAAWRLGWLLRAHADLMDEHVLRLRLAAIARGVDPDDPLTPKEIEDTIESGIAAGKSGKGRTRAGGAA